MGKGLCTLILSFVLAAVQTASAETSANVASLPNLQPSAPATAVASAPPANPEAFDGWTAASQVVYSVFHKSCPVATDTSTDSADQSAYLVGLGKQRLSSVKCGTSLVMATRKDPAALAAYTTDVAQKLVLIMQMRQSADRELAAMRASAPGTPSMPFTSDYKTARARYLAIMRAQEATLDSIEYISTPAVRLLVRNTLAMNYDGGRPPPSIESLQKTLSAPSGVPSTLAQAQDQLEGEDNNLTRAITSNFKNADHNLKESLVQDGGLISTMTDKGLACRMDAKYGAGAKERDIAYMVGQVGIGLGSFGVGYAANALEAAAAVRTAAAVGATGLRVTQFAMIAGQAATAIPQIEKTCSGLNEVGGSEQNTCEKFDIKQLRRNNCGLAIVLNAASVGGELAEAGEQVLNAAGKAIVAEWVPTNSRLVEHATLITKMNKSVASPLNTAQQHALFDAHFYVAGQLGADGTDAAVKNYRDGLAKDLSLMRGGVTQEDSQLILRNGLAARVNPVVPQASPAAEATKGISLPGVSSEQDQYLRELLSQAADQAHAANLESDSVKAIQRASWSQKKYEFQDVAKRFFGAIPATRYKAELDTAASGFKTRSKVKIYDALNPKRYMIVDPVGGYFRMVDNGRYMTIKPELGDQLGFSPSSDSANSHLLFADGND